MSTNASNHMQEITHILKGFGLTDIDNIYFNNNIQASEILGLTIDGRISLLLVYQLLELYVNDEVIETVLEKLKNNEDLITKIDGNKKIEVLKSDLFIWYREICNDIKNNLENDPNISQEELDFNQQSNQAHETIFWNIKRNKEYPIFHHQHLAIGLNFEESISSKWLSPQYLILCNILQEIINEILFQIYIEITEEQIETLDIESIGIQKELENRLFRRNYTEQSIINHYLRKQ